LTERSNLYVADSGYSVIDRITPTGVVLAFAWKASDGTGAAAQFNQPTGIAVGPEDNGTVREITPAGLVTTVAGSPRSAGFKDGVGIQAGLTGPNGITVDASGNVFVACGDGTVRRGIRTANTQGAVRLLNLSSRGQVSPGMPLIAGFSIQGPLSETLLIRAIGPALQQFGVSGTLPNPPLDVYAQGAVRIASSANGMNTTNFQSAGALVGAFPLPANGGDAALVMTFSPGLYTAQATSPTGASGSAMLEVYEIP
jgi:hypothetical protein